MKQKQEQGLIRKLATYAKPYIPYFIIGPLCMIVEVIGEVLMPKFLSAVVTGGTDGTMTAGKSIFYAAMMILTALCMMGGGVGGSYFDAKASVNFAADMRVDVYRKVQQYSFANIDKFSTGSLVTRLTNDVTQVQNFVNMMLRMSIRAPGMMIGALIMAITIRPSLSTVFAVAIPVLFVSIFSLVRMGFPRFSKMQEKLDRLNATVQENVTNVRVVKSFVREDHEKDKFRRANGDLKKAGLRAMNIMILLSPVMTIVMNVTVIAVLWFGGQIVLNEAGMVGGMQIGDLSAFVTYVTQILSSLMMITAMLMMSSRALASARRISEVLEEEIDLDDSHAAQPQRQVENGEIRFEHVSFRYYKNSAEQVLHDINLTIPAHTTVGIIGSTGCGKSTLVSMIPRLYDCDEGRVLIDGVDVKDYSLYHLREGVSMVLQKNVLFSGSIADNLRWGDETADEETVRAAAKMAQADGFVTSFPEGYQTDLVEGGSNVSGGQKQRLCIARALLKNPKILILDDSTSAVDTATETQIRAAFRTSLSNATKIIIAQRITSVMDADLIVVMDEGEIVGTGTHTSLLQNNETYREIYDSQMEQKQEVRA